MNYKFDWKHVLYAFLVIWLIASVYSKTLPLPEGVNVEGNVYNISDEDIDFLYDLNYYNETDSDILEQEIFDKVFDLIDNSNQFILLDMFLFNTDYSQSRFINLTTILTEKLVGRSGDIPVFFTTDEINNFYGSYTSEEIQTLEENDVIVTITDHTEMRDVNFIYAGFWRAYLQWWGTSGKGTIAHPLGREDTKVTVRSFLKLMNTKANHRKVLVSDCDTSICSLITSANPHEASSLHSNVAVLIKKGIWKDIVDSEQAIAKWSGTDYAIEYIAEENYTGNIQVQLLTEKAIRDNMVMDMDSTESGDKIDMAMFYLSDRKVIKAMKRALERGVEVNLILDPNKDAFAREKNGVPNRPVANELVKTGANVKWYDTKGAQFHSKLLIITKDGEQTTYIGSANLTKRNIGNFNLELNAKIFSPLDTNFATEVSSYFERIWSNEDGTYTVDFEAYEDTSIFRYLLYRFQEATGLSSF